MATTKKITSTKKPTTRTTATKKVASNKVENTANKTVTKELENTAEEVVLEEEVTKEPKNFKETDLIPCMCVFPGSVGMTGKRTRNVYHWDGMGSIEYVEFQDLRSEVLNKKSTYIYEPLIIISDDDFLDLNPKLHELYSDYYTPDEIIEVIEDSYPEEMKEFIENLPYKLKDNVKTIASTLVQNGELDSIRKVKIIDKIFGTNLEVIS